MKTGNFQQGTMNGNKTNTTSRVGNRNGAPVSGKIIKVDSTSITVQTSDGSNKIVMISDTTKVNKTAETVKTELKEGETVMVIGNTDSTTGSITATTINLGTTAMAAPADAPAGDQAPSITK